MLRERVVLGGGGRRWLLAVVVLFWGVLPRAWSWPLVPPRCCLQRISFPRALQEVGNSLSPFNLGFNFGFNLGIFCAAGRPSPSRSPPPPAEQCRALQPLPGGVLFFFSFLSKFPSRFCCPFSPCFHHGFLPWCPGEHGSGSAPGRARPRRSAERAALESKKVVVCFVFFFGKDTIICLCLPIPRALGFAVLISPLQLRGGRLVYWS